MKKRFALGLVTAATALTTVLAVPATASASPLEPHPAFSTGSLTLCFNFPIGPIKISIC